MFLIPPSDRFEQELALVERFTGMYRRQLSEVMGPGGNLDTPRRVRCARMCSEAMQMLHASETQLASALGELQAMAPGPDVLRRAV